MNNPDTLSTNGITWALKQPDGTPYPDDAPLVGAPLPKIDRRYQTSYPSERINKEAYDA